MGGIERYRFRNYVVAPDLMAAREFGARCVWGPEVECGARAQVSSDIAEVDRWMVEHFRDTGHDAFRRTLGDYAKVQAGEWA